MSVTQAFNTTTSMGRLTLNVLLSFAQFEREVTGERIRDKIAASKKKGMWMGGQPSLGYWNGPLLSGRMEAAGNVARSMTDMGDRLKIPEREIGDQHDEHDRRDAQETREAAADGRNTVGGGGPVPQSPTASFSRMWKAMNTTANRANSPAAA